MARVATAFGESTIPDILPSQGQHDSSRYACIELRYIYSFWCWLVWFGAVVIIIIFIIELRWKWLEGVIEKPPNLLLGVSKFREVVDGIEDCSLVGYCCIEEVLPPCLIYADSFEDQPLWEPRLHRPYLKDWAHMKNCGAHWCQVLSHSTPNDFTPAKHNMKRF